MPNAPCNQEHEDQQDWPRRSTGGWREATNFAGYELDRYAELSAEDSERVERRLVGMQVQLDR